MRGAALGVVIALAYVGGRWAVYRAMPVVEILPVTAAMRREAAAELLARIDEDRSAAKDGPVAIDGRALQADYDYVLEGKSRLWRKDWWLRRDATMTLLRLPALAACLWVMASAGGLRRWGWAWSGGPLLIAAVFGAAAHHLSQWYTYPCDPMTWSGVQKAQGWLQTLPVAFMEEACFRGLLFLGLREAWGARRAGLASSVLFALYHVQALPVSGMARTFVTGIAWCALVHRGVGLPWLVVAHEAIDGVWFNVGDQVSGGARLWVFRLDQALLLATVAAAWAGLGGTGVGSAGEARGSPSEVPSAAGAGPGTTPDPTP